MSNDWLRLWHDMPNDPKWRTIARASGKPIPAVIAVYVHMLVCASNATERGRTQGWCDEDVANALDLTTDDVNAIREAMQGRVLENDYLKGWEKRQPKREDGGAERAKAWREKKKDEAQRKRTQANAEKRPEEDTDTEEERKKKTIKKEIFTLPEWIPPNDWDAFMEVRKAKKAADTVRAKKAIVTELERLRVLGHDPIAILQKSIRNSWKDVFEPKGETYADRTNPTKPSSVDKRLAALYRAGTGSGGGKQVEPGAGSGETGFEAEHKAGSANGTGTAIGLAAPGRAERNHGVPRETDSALSADEHGGEPVALAV